MANYGDLVRTYAELSGDTETQSKIAVRNVLNAVIECIKKDGWLRVRDSFSLKVVPKSGKYKLVNSLAGKPVQTFRNAYVKVKLAHDLTDYLNENF